LIFFFQVKYRLSYCLTQQMSEVKRRIFIYLQLTYDWLPIFLQPVIAMMLLIHEFSPKFVSSQTCENSGSQHNVVYCFVYNSHISSIVISFVFIIHKLFSIFAENKTSVINTTLLI